MVTDPVCWFSEPMTCSACTAEDVRSNLLEGVTDWCCHLHWLKSQPRWLESSCVGSLQKEAEGFDRKKEKDTWNMWTQHLQCVQSFTVVTLYMIICIIYYDDDVVKCVCWMCNKTIITSLNILFVQISSVLQQINNDKIFISNLLFFFCFKSRLLLVCHPMIC